MSSTIRAVRRMNVTSTTIAITSAARMSSENRIGGMFGLGGWLRIWLSAVAAPLPSTPWPAMAAVNALAASIALPHTIRLTLAATPATTTRGAISLSPYCDWRVSREAMMKPPAMTNSTKMALAVTRLVVQIALTCGLAVSFGVDRTVWPSASRTGLRPVLAIQAMKSLIALRIWPGMSNSPGSLLLSGDGEVNPGGVGPGAGDGVPGGAGVGFPVGGPGIGLGVGFGGVGVLSGLGGTPGSGTPTPGVGAGSAHAGLVPAATAAPVARTTPSTSSVSSRTAAVRQVTGRMSLHPARDNRDDQRRQQREGIADRGGLQRRLALLGLAGVAVGPHQPQPADGQEQGGDGGEDRDQPGTDVVDHRLNRVRRQHRAGLCGVRRRAVAEQEHRTRREDDCGDDGHRRQQPHECGCAGPAVAALVGAGGRPPTRAATDSLFAH